MADTTPLAPTDADILRALKQSWPIRGAPIEMVQPTREQFIAFARAVLAEWGAQPVAREPLTLDEFRKAFHEYTGCIVGTNQGLLMAAKSATERAHGIKKGGRHDTD